LRRLSGAGPLDVNDPNVGPIFVNAAGQQCLNYGGTATELFDQSRVVYDAPLDAYTPYTQQWNFTVQRQLKGGWALESVTSAHTSSVASASGILSWQFR
jgi:hypothetical protein